MLSARHVQKFLSPAASRTAWSALCWTRSTAEETGYIRKLLQFVCEPTEVCVGFEFFMIKSKESQFEGQWAACNILFTHLTEEYYEL